MSCCALIVAAGEGRRLDPSVPKAYLPLAGRPLIAWTVATFSRCAAIDSVVVVAAAAQLKQMRASLAAEGLLGDEGSGRLVLCAGGAERSDSVWAGLQQLPGEVDLVAVHDGARALVSPELITRVVDAAARHGAALAALPLTDTVKEQTLGASGDAASSVLRTPPRESLRLAQTPQVFATALLRGAYERYRALPPSTRPPLTDDAQVVELFGGGHAVRLVEGEATNFKITVAQDLLLAEALLGRKAAPMHCSHRTGFGYDVHCLAEPAGGDRRLVLGGVTIPHRQVLLGHSDADVLCHAAGDALLGAAALGDLGRHFPPGDPRFRDACSLDLLAEIATLVARAGYRLVNLDTTVVCQEPRIAPHGEAMRDNLARALGVERGQVSVKATTTEGLGFAGRGEGIAAYATAQIVAHDVDPFCVDPFCAGP